MIVFLLPITAPLYSRSRTVLNAVKSQESYGEAPCCRAGLYRDAWSSCATFQLDFTGKPDAK